MSDSTPENQAAQAPEHEPEHGPKHDRGALPAGLPSRTAFLLAFASVVFAGIFGGIIGYGLVDVSCTGDCQNRGLIGAVVGAAIAAGGVGIVAVLVLRAMSEWKRRS